LFLLLLAVVVPCVVIIILVLVVVVVVVVVVDSTWQRKLKELVAVNGAKIECFALAFAVTKQHSENRKLQDIGGSVVQWLGGVVVHFRWLQLLITCLGTAHITGAGEPRCGCCWRASNMAICCSNVPAATSNSHGVCN